MTITNYKTLRDALARWIHRADAIASIPEFIALAESRITADLVQARPLWSRRRATLPAGSDTLAMPDDALAFVGCALVLSGELRELPVHAISAVQWTSTASGQPTAVGVSGQTLHFDLAADQAYTVEVIFHAQVPALGDALATNWVIERAPQLYLYGALLESVGFTGETAKVPVWSTFYEQALDRLKKISWEGPVRAVTDIPVGRGGFDITRGY